MYQPTDQSPLELKDDEKFDWIIGSELIYKQYNIRSLAVGYISAICPRNFQLTKFILWPLFNVGCDTQQAIEATRKWSICFCCKREQRA